MTWISEISVRPLDIPLREPFGIATGAQLAARNVLVEVRLRGGAVGFGEAAPFPAVNGETQEMALSALARAQGQLLGQDARAWRALGPLLRELMPESPSARCAVETAVLDALCRGAGLPLWALFGGAGQQLETDLTITTGDAPAAAAAAARIAAAGYGTIKLKVGGAPLEEDGARLRAVAAAAPGLGLILDGNGGLPGVEGTLQLLDAARAAGARVVLLEQPLPRDDLDGMRALCARAGAPVCADESAGSVADVVRLGRAGAAQVVNLKIMKSGLIEALDMALAARALGLGLMIGGMVESPLALTTSACLAAGLGGFGFVDLDTHLFMRDVPLVGGFAQAGPRLDLSAIAAGHGVGPAAASGASRVGDGGASAASGDAA